MVGLYYSVSILAGRASDPFVAPPCISTTCYNRSTIYLLGKSCTSHLILLCEPDRGGAGVRASAIQIRAGVVAGVLLEKPVYTLLARAQPFYKCIVPRPDSALD